MKKVLMITGGWEGHDPVRVAERFARVMRGEGYEVDVFDNYDVLLDECKLREYCLFVPHCTMGHLPDGATENISKAIAAGMGLAGCHGGMCDAFRDNPDWQFICGGQWVSHPGGQVQYTVDIIPGSSPLIEGIESFSIFSEQYYMHIDPAIEVLATTRFPVATSYHSANKPVDIPVIWTKYWGNGRVFYFSIGHSDETFADYPVTEEIMRRGLVWAAEGKEYAEKHNLTTERFEQN